VIRLKRTREEAAQPTHIGTRRAIHGSETILVVEDQPMLRELMHTVLRLHGYNVLAAETPTGAIQKAQGYGRPIHLLLTDVIMPGMNGRKLADQLRSARPSLRVLFMSGYTDQAILEYGELPQGTSFLAKPFTPEALLSRLRDVLDKPLAAA
jgi:CheY-like chemotaxis protein